MLSVMKLTGQINSTLDSYTRIMCRENATGCDFVEASLPQTIKEVKIAITAANDIKPSGDICTPPGEANSTLPVCIDAQATYTATP